MTTRSCCGCCPQVHARSNACQESGQPDLRSLQMARATPSRDDANATQHSQLHGTRPSSQVQREAGKTAAVQGRPFQDPLLRGPSS